MNRDIQQRLLAFADYEEKRIQNSLADAEEADGQHQILVQKFMVFLFPELQKISKEFHDFIAEARGEMGIEGNDQPLRDQTDEMFRRTLVSLKPLMDP